MDSRIKFGTGGFRGIIGDDFNKENLQLIAQALSNIIIRQNNNALPVIIGYDNRFLSDIAAKWMSESFAGNGIKVLLFDYAVPTPAVMFSAKQKGNGYGIMITASHNPYLFNGVKVFYKNGIDADVQFTSVLEKEIGLVKDINVIAYSQAKQTGIISGFDDIDDYLLNIKRFISEDIKNNNLKILYDNMCGTGICGLKPLLNYYEIKKVDYINENRDAFFNFNVPNPSELVLQKLKEKLVKENYDFAIATDSDGDRLGVLDEKGNFINNNDILGVLYYYLVKYKGMKGDVVKNCSTSVMIDKIAEKLGFKCHEVDVGFKNISSKMLEIDALIGGESSGGLTVRNYIMGKDSVFSAMLFIEMVIKMQKPVSAIIREVHQFAEYDCYTHEESIEFNNEKIWGLLQKNNPFDKNLKKSECFNNNIKYYLSGGWALLRMSGTEPVLRIVSESKTLAEAEQNVSKLKNFIEGKIHELQRKSN